MHCENVLPVSGDGLETESGGRIHSTIMKELLLTLVLIAAAIILLGVRVFFTKNGRFPSGHVKDQKALRSKGIGCAMDNEEMK